MDVYLFIVALAVIDQTQHQQSQASTERKSGLAECAVQY